MNFLIYYTTSVKPLPKPESWNHGGNPIFQFNMLSETVQVVIDKK